jgi:hypothetical protein
MITIDGINDEQAILLDHMWSLKTEDEFDLWYTSLDLHTQQQADLMQWLLILAYQDDKVDNLDLANQAINKVKSRIVYKR